MKAARAVEQKFVEQGIGEFRRNRIARCPAGADNARNTVLCPRENQKSPLRQAWYGDWTIQGGSSAQTMEGLDQLAEAAKLVETTHEGWVDAEIHRLRGTLLLSMHEHAAAENSYRRALEVAQRQSAKFWELRAALELRHCCWCVNSNLH